VFYIYGLFDPRDGEVFYIGKGSRDRISTHFQGSSRGENPRKDNKIDKIVSLGLEPIAIRLIEGLEEEDAYRLEREIILGFGRKDYDPDGILMNLCLDARPPSPVGRTVSPETREKIGAAQRGKLNHRYGKEWDEEQKELRRQFNLENGIKPPVRSGPMSDEQKAAIGAGNRGKKRTAEQSAYLSEIRKGKKRAPMSEEAKRKSSEAQKGKKRRPLTDEEKAAQSERVKAIWARRKAEKEIANKPD
jgi:hypothetical protein